MNPTELMKAVCERSTDSKGISDRFLGNAELYEKCFRAFLQSRSHVELGKAIAERDYKLAFEAAHSLKGVSGNLGLSAYYNAVCKLTESLRAGGSDSTETEYAVLCDALHELSGFLG